MQPETVIRWHRGGFKLYWKWLSRKHPVVGRKPTRHKLRELIFRMVAENRTWGAVNERHLKRLMNEYVSYYHDDRTHLALGKETPLAETQ